MATSPDDKLREECCAEADAINEIWSSPSQPWPLATKRLIAFARQQQVAALRDLADAADSPMPTGEPRESIWLGRQQVIDDIRARANQLESKAQKNNE